MSKKSLCIRHLRWLGSFVEHRRTACALLMFLTVVWLTPVGLKWLLVQQLQVVLKREVIVHAVQLHPLSLSLSVDGLSVKNTEGDEMVGWQRLTVDVSATSFVQRAWVLDALRLQNPRVSVVHLGQGRFDFSDLLESSTDSKGLPLFVLHEVSVQDGRVSLEDRPLQRTHTVENFKLVLPQVSSLSGKNGVMLMPDLSANFNGAPLHVAGTVRPVADTPDVVLALSVDALDVSNFQAYMPQSLSMRLAKGKLSTDLKLHFSQVAGRMALLLNGTAQLQDVVLNDLHDRSLLSFKSLALNVNASDVLGGKFIFSDVMLESPQTLVHIDPAGQLNWTTAWPPATPAHSQPRQAGTALFLQVDQLSLRNGMMYFADTSVEPIVQTRITHLNGVMNNVSTQAGTQADMTLKANLGSAAQLSVQARLQPLNVTAFLDAKWQATGVDLTRFSGYAQKYLGYPLNKGRLSVDANYHIQNKQLQADNHVVIDHLTFGTQVPSPHAIDAPVSLGVSLLKNSSGQIDIHLPVSGSVDAPEFSLGGLVAQTLGHVLVKVVTSPLRALGSLLGDEDPQD